MFHNYETVKITRKASDSAENLQLYGVVRFFWGFLPPHWLYEWFSSAENVRRYLPRAWRSRVEEPNSTL